MPRLKNAGALYFLVRVGRANAVPDKRRVCSPCGAALRVKHCQDVIDGQPIRRWRFLHNCLVIAPSEFSGTRNQTGTYGIEHNVSGQFQQVRVLIQQNGLVSTLQNVAHPSVVPIERLGVNTIDLAHAF